MFFMFLSKSYVWLPRKFKNQYFLFYSYIFLATNQSTKTQKKKKNYQSETSNNQTKTSSNSNPTNKLVNLANQNIET